MSPRYLDAAAARRRWERMAERDLAAFRHDERWIPAAAWDALAERLDQCAEAATIEGLALVLRDRALDARWRGSWWEDP